MSARLVELDIVKGMAIFLVVIGHIVARADVPGAQWYSDLRLAIYAFHMPLFMVLSGMALGLSWRKRPNWSSVGTMVWSRIQRLLLPYLVFGTLIVIGKLVASHVTPIDNPPDGLVNGLLAILLFPMQSAASFLWYIHVLALFFLTIPWLMQASEKTAPFVLLVLGIVAQHWAWTSLLDIAGYAEYLPFFSAGVLIGQHQQRIMPIVFRRDFLVVAFALFASTLYYAMCVDLLPKWLTGACATPFFLSLAYFLPSGIQSFYNALGNQTLAIYLLNTIYIGLSKAVLLPFIPFRDQYFVIYFFVLGIAGIYLPMLTKKVLQRVRPSWAAYI